MINCSSFLSSSIHSHTTESQGGGYSTFLTLARRRIILVITTIIVCATIIPSPTAAQTPNWMGGIGALCDSSSGVAYYLGRVGVRTATPLVPLHIHSGYCLTGDSTIYPAIERLQTQSNFSTYNFGQSAIQFWSGGLGTGQDWAVSAIKPVSNASPLIFNTGDTTSPDNWLGGMAFYCSALGQRPTGGEIEVMRIVDEKVGIRTPNPLGTLDVNVGTLTANWPKISFASGVSSADSCPSPQIRFYSPFSLIETTPDRIKSYSWYIQSLRQYDPACYTNLDGSSQPGVSINTTLGALHIRAGYDPVKADTPSVGDIYSSETGEEESIARMSLLSNGNVGINNEIPMVRFNVCNGAVLFDGEQGRTPLKRVDTSGLVSAQEIGAGTRLMWIPNKAAFRAGKIDSNFWNTNNIGEASIALGRNPIASGQYTTAIGWNAHANPISTHGCIAIGHDVISTGTDALSLGHENIASGDFSGAFGELCQSTAATAFAMGQSCISSGSGSFSAGGNNQASGAYSVALSSLNRATGTNSIAIGYKDSATADNAVAIGSQSNASGEGAMALGQYVKADGANEILIGSGLSTTNPLKIYSGGGGLTNNENSLGIGFLSNVPTFYVGPAVGGGLGGIGTVGIGTTNPKNLLDVRGALAIGWGVTLPSYTSLATSNKVGIITTSPACSLGVNGTVCVGWDGTKNVPSPSSGNPADDSAHTVSMIVENTVIIHGRDSSGTLVPAYVHDVADTNYGASKGGSYLQVWGEAIKFKGTSAWDIPSDARYKKDIHPFEDGLQLLKQVQPVRYKYSEKLGIRGTEEGIGVIAQDIQKILPYTVHEQELVTSIQTKKENRYEVDKVDTFVIRVIDYSKSDTTTQRDSSELDEHGHSNHRYSIVYKDSTIYKPRKQEVIEPAEFENVTAPLLTYNSSAVTYVLINSVKELDSLRVVDKQELIEKIISQNSKIESQNSKIESQNSTIDSLILANKNFEERIARLETKNQISLDDASDVILEQNNPNPFSESTTITYYIPEKVQGEVELVITSATDQTTVLQRIPCTKGMPIQTIISARDMHTGVYVYSLSGSGRILATKKLIIIK